MESSPIFDCRANELRKDENFWDTYSEARFERTAKEIAMTASYLFCASIVTFLGIIWQGTKEFMNAKPFPSPTFQLTLFFSWFQRTEKSRIIEERPLVLIQKTSR